MTQTSDLETKNCVILANGTFPTTKKPLEALKATDFICCCDGAVEKLVNAGYNPNAIVGDGDSIPTELRKRFADIFLKISEQDYNDLTKATRYCLSKGFRKITYLGATGLREDHTIGNIFLLPFYLQEFGIEAEMITDEGIFIPMTGDSVFAAEKGQQVSIFNINCKSLSATGLRYPLSPFSQLWQGTLNEAVCGQITVEADGVFLVFKQF